MGPTKELIDGIFRDRVLRARQTPLEKKILAGLELFDGVCHRMMAGIRHQFPHFNDDEVEQELHRRLRINRRLENARDK